MKRITWMVVASCLLWTGQALAVDGNVNVFLGEKQLNSNDWGPANWGDSFDQQTELGVLFDIRGDNWPVSVAVDLLYSSEAKSYGWGDHTASTAELDFGVRKVFDIGGTSLHPYAGGGFGFMRARYAVDFFGFTYSYDSDASTGVWLDGGIYWTFARHFDLGVDARYSKAEVTVFDTKVNAGGTHLGVRTGFHW